MSEDRGGQKPAPDDLDPEDLPEDDLPDQGEDAAETEGDAEEGDDAEAPPAQQRQQPRETRAQTRIRQLSEQNREQRERLARIEGQLQERSRAAPAVDPAVEEQRFYESIALMAPEQMAQAITRRLQGQFDQRSQRTELFVGDALDRQTFAQLRRDEPAAQRLSSQVETVLASERQAGRNPTRETIYNYLVGQEVRSKSQRAGAQQRRQGQQRIARETTTPGNARSTVAAETARRRGNESLADLEDRIGDIPL